MTMAQFTPPQPLTEKQNRAALRLMDRLDKWLGRMNSSPKQTKKLTTICFRKRVCVFVPESFEQISDRETKLSFEAWALNLSTGGITVIFPGQLQFDRAVICLNPEELDKQLLYVRLIQCRRVAEEFWQYRFEFEARVEPQAESLDSATLESGL